MKKILIPAILLILANSSFAQKKKEQDSKQQSKAPPPIPVTVIEVKQGKATITQDLAGRISAYKTAEVRARVNGIIKKRFFTEGSFVNKGDVLFKIEDSILKATLKVRVADLANAKANSELVTKTLRRYKKLLKQGAVSKQEYDTYEAQSKQASSQVQQAKANLEIAKINLEFTTVQAPISGRIDKALINEGGLARTNTTPLATIEQLDKVYVDFTQSSSELTNLHKIQSQPEIEQTNNKNITILFDNGQSYPEKGQLQFSSMNIDQSTGSASLRAIVSNPNKQLLPGMFVRVRMPILDKKDVIKVPQKAVQILSNGPAVFIVKNNQLVPLSVDLGEMAGTSWIINSGLKTGTRVVISDITFPLQTRSPVVGMTKQEMQQMMKQKSGQTNN